MGNGVQTYCGPSLASQSLIEPNASAAALYSAMQELGNVTCRVFPIGLANSEWGADLLWTQFGQPKFARTFVELLVNGRGHQSGSGDHAFKQMCKYSSRDWVCNDSSNC